MTQLIETRWTRYGKDLVYVKTSVGDEVGHVDLVAQVIVAKSPSFETELHECLARWTAALKPPTELASGPSGPSETPRDLAANAAGAAARAKRDQVNAQAPMRYFVARILGVKTDERAWRIGANGETKVARELATLGPAWRVLHVVEVGQNGSDIDHVVIGPPGVITLNTKCHPDGKAWVSEHQVMVNGQRVPYLRNSRHEAERATRLLSTACGRPIVVSAAIVFVDLVSLKEKQMPQDVHVTTRPRLVRWLKSLPIAIDETAVNEIYSKASLSTTWQ